MAAVVQSAVQPGPNNFVVRPIVVICTQSRKSFSRSMKHSSPIASYPLIGEHLVLLPRVVSRISQSIGCASAPHIRCIWVSQYCSGVECFDVSCSVNGILMLDVVAGFVRGLLGVDHVGVYVVLDGGAFILVHVFGLEGRQLDLDGRVTGFGVRQLRHTTFHIAIQMLRRKVWIRWYCRADALVNGWRPGGRDNGCARHVGDVIAFDVKVGMGLKGLRFVSAVWIQRYWQEGL